MIFRNAGNLRRLTGVVLLGIALSGCLHDTEIRLNNSVPQIVGGGSQLVNRHLFYPDSSVCTLQVRDLNDSSLSVDSGSWPGAYRQLDTTLQDKRIELMWPSGLLGIKTSGTLQIADQNQGSVGAPYSIDKIFSDPLRSYPPASWWAVSQPGDSSGYVRVGPGVQGNQIEFYFPQSSQRRSAATVEFVSKFRLAGSFRWTVDSYALKPYMRPGFEVRFAVSTSPDTSIYAGDRAELILSGSGNGLSLSYRGPNYAVVNVAVDTSFYGLPLRFVRLTDDSIHIMRGDPRLSFSDVDQPVMFNAAIPVYIHMRMTVTDFTEDRYLALYQFTIDQGEIVP